MLQFYHIRVAGLMDEMQSEQCGVTVSHRTNTTLSSLCLLKGLCLYINAQE